jgi:outer membrane protein TolC
LYDFGGRGAHIRSARSVLDATAGSLNSASHHVIFSVVQAYYGVVAADELLIAAKTTEETGARTVAITRALPLTARMSDLMAEATRQRPDLAAALAQRDAAEANVTVARALGRPSISFQGGHELSNTVGVPDQS